jgi:hypothetical protein
MQEAYVQKWKKKKANQKSRQAAAGKAARKPNMGTVASSGGTFERGGEYKPGIKFRKDMDRKTKSEFLRLRGAYHTTGTKEVKVDRVKSTEQLLEDATSDE